MNMKSLLPSMWGEDRDRDDPFRSLHRQIDRVFEDFARGLPSLTMPGEAAEGVRLSPRIDVSETDKAIEITAELPGVEEKDVDVSLSDNRLTIKGEKKSEREEKEKSYHLLERSYGAFERTIAIPFDIDSDKVEAQFEKGVLKVTLPKPPETKARSRKIAIKSAG